MADDRAMDVVAWEGPLSPPRRNGEVVFDHVWESRLFGMTMALYEAGAFQWDEFRNRLIAAIASWDREHAATSAEYRYWDCWLEALERLVAAKEICPADILSSRVAELAARPHGYDHQH